MSDAARYQDSNERQIEPVSISEQVPNLIAEAIKLLEKSNIPAQNVPKEFGDLTIETGNADASISKENAEVGFGVRQKRKLSPGGDEVIPERSNPKTEEALEDSPPHPPDIDATPADAMMRIAKQLGEDLKTVRDGDGTERKAELSHAEIFKTMRALADQFAPIVATKNLEQMTDAIVDLNQDLEKHASPYRVFPYGGSPEKPRFLGLYTSDTDLPLLFIPLTPRLYRQTQPND